MEVKNLQNNNKKLLSNVARQCFGIFYLDYFYDDKLNKFDDYIESNDEKLTKEYKGEL